MGPLIQSIPEVLGCYESLHPNRHSSYLDLDVSIPYSDPDRTLGIGEKELANQEI